MNFDGQQKRVRWQPLLKEQTPMFRAADYFAWWNGDPINVGGQFMQAQHRLIHPYFSRFGQWSLSLTIPRDWQALYLPGQVQRGGLFGPDSLPPGLASMINTLGFEATQFYGAGRLYGLRRHDFPITVALYQAQILPRLRTTELGPLRGLDGKPIPVPQGQRFERALTDARWHHLHHIEQLSQAPTHDLAAWVDFIQAHGSDEGWANL